MGGHIKNNENMYILLVASEDNGLLLDLGRMARKAHARVSSYSHQQWLEYLKSSQGHSTFGQRPEKSPVPELISGNYDLFKTPTPKTTITKPTPRASAPTTPVSAAPVPAAAAPMTPVPTAPVPAAAAPTTPVPTTPVPTAPVPTVPMMAKGVGQRPQPVDRFSSSQAEASRCPLVKRGAQRPMGQVLAFSRDPSTMQDIQRQAILSALEKCHHNVTQTSRQLGIGRATLYRKMKRYGIDLNSARPSTDSKKIAA